MTHHSHRFRLAALVGAAVVICACSSASDESSRVPLLEDVDASTFDPRLGAPNVVADGSIGDGPSTIGEAIDTSDLVVVGTVGAAARGWHFDLGPNKGMYDRNSPVTVERVLSGDATSIKPGSVLVVRQQGIQDDGYGSQFEFDPWLREGQRVVVFLDSASGNNARPDEKSVVDERGPLFDMAVPTATLVDVKGELAALFPDNPTAAWCGLDADEFALGRDQLAARPTGTCAEVPQSFERSSLVRINFGTEQRPREVIVDLDKVGDAREINIGTVDRPEIVPFDAHAFRDAH